MPPIDPRFLTKCQAELDQMWSEVCEWLETISATNPKGLLETLNCIETEETTAWLDKLSEEDRNTLVWLAAIAIREAGTRSARAETNEP